jgi:hypothetical protein
MVHIHWVLWRGEMGCSVGAVERREGLQCGCCGEESWAAVSVGAVERYLLPCQELDPKSPVLQHIGCLITDRNKFIFCAVEF